MSKFFIDSLPKWEKLFYLFQAFKESILNGSTLNIAHPGNP